MTVMRKYYLSLSGSGQHPTSDPPSRSTADRAPLARVQTSRRRAPTAHRRTRRIAPCPASLAQLRAAPLLSVESVGLSTLPCMAPHRRRAGRVAGGSQAKASEAGAKRERTTSEARTNHEQARREPGANAGGSQPARTRGVPGVSEASAHARADASMNGLHARDSSSEPARVDRRARGCLTQAHAREGLGAATRTGYARASRVWGPPVQPSACARGPRAVGHSAHARKGLGRVDRRTREGHHQEPGVLNTGRARAGGGAAARRHRRPRRRPRNPQGAHAGGDHQEHGETVPEPAETRKVDYVKSENPRFPA